MLNYPKMPRNTLHHYSVRNQINSLISSNPSVNKQFFPFLKKTSGKKPKTK